MKRRKWPSKVDARNVLRGGVAECRRNLADEVFPGRCPEERLAAVGGKLSGAIAGLKCRFFRGGKIVSGREDLRTCGSFGIFESRGMLSDGAEWDRKGVYLVELNCVEPDTFAVAAVNLEDHTAIYVAAPDPDGAFRTADGIAGALARKLDFAKSPEFGFLTSNPALSGTGMRISCELSLPGLWFCGETDQVLNSADRLYFGTSPAWKDRTPEKGGTEVPGYVERFSCVLSAGESGRQMARFCEFCDEVVTQERGARARYLLGNPVRAVDYVTRAQGIGMSACVLDEYDVHDIVSALEFGSGIGFVACAADEDSMFFRRLEASFLDSRLATGTQSFDDESVRDRYRAMEFSEALLGMKMPQNLNVWFSKLNSLVSSAGASLTGF